MMNKWIGIIIVLVVLMFGFFIVTKNNSSMKTQAPAPTPMKIVESPTTAVTASPSGSMTKKGATEEVTVTGSNFTFDKKEITVKEGDTIKLTFRNSGGFHNWKIDEFNAATKVISDGQTDTIEFVADKKGTFEYYCSVGNHRQMGMKGNLIVE